ncbi:MAG: hypothetical protein ACE5PT_13720 [Gemmatimonadales bacterium]
MTSNNRERLIFHGAIVLFVGLLCGFPAAAEWSGEPLHLWLSAHLGLVMTGIWLLATASVLPSLVLERREASVLVWSLLATAYGFMTAGLIEAVTRARAFQPTGSPANLVAFVGNAVGVLGALLGVLLTLMGARAALKRLRVG